MRRAGVVAAAVVAGVLLVPGAAQAAEKPPGAAMSDNLEYVTRVADTNQVVEGKFDRVRNKDVLVITGRFGFKTNDVSDPDNPKPLDAYLPPELNPGGYWQNEDMELDTKRKLIIGALDPRHTELGATETSPCPPGGSVNNPNCKAGFYVISYADPANLKQIGDFVALPSGHTSSCIQDCKYIWTGGPARTRNPDLRWLGPILSPTAADPNNVFTRLVGNGRPIWVTDLTNPARPEVSDQPVDLWRNDGYTDYSHDVDEDEQGIAWVSGRGGIRGYATSGYHRDPYQNRYRKATPFDPILVAGGGVAGTSRARDADAQLRPPDGRRGAGGRRQEGQRAGRHRGGVPGLLRERPDHHLGPHGLVGRRAGAAVDAERAVPDEGARHVPPDPRRGEEDAGDVSCSAHYFEIEGSTLGAGWYGLGLRLLDISDARNIRQVGVLPRDGLRRPSRPRTRGTWRSGRIAARAT